jgi:response regulator NasT
MAVSRHEEMVALAAEVSSLSERLETRKLVERAKGQLMAKHGWSEPQAFRWIQKASMDRRLSMREVAQIVMDDAAERG